MREKEEEKERKRWEGVGAVKPLYIYKLSKCSCLAFVFRYKAWREPPDAKLPHLPYDLSKEYWEIVAARMFFVIVFEVIYSYSFLVLLGYYTYICTAIATILSLGLYHRNIQHD